MVDLVSSETCLITGATGFTGRHLVKALVEHGKNVHVLIRASSDSKSLQALLPESSIHIHYGDATRLENIIALVRPNEIFHLAAWCQFENSLDDIDTAIASNINLGVYLLECAVQHGPVSFIHAGTSWQTFESASYRPINLYAATKQAFESIAKHYVESFGVKFASLRLFDSYGVGDTRPKVLNVLLRGINSDEPLGMSPGEQKMILVHVDDVVDAFQKAAQSLRKAPQGSFFEWFLDSGERYSLKEVHAVLEKVVGHSVKVVWGARPYRDKEVMHIGEQRATVPNWAPRYDLESGLRQVLKHDQMIRDEQ